MSVARASRSRWTLLREILTTCSDSLFPMIRLVIACFLFGLCPSLVADNPLRGRMPENLMPDLKDVIAVALEDSSDMEVVSYLEREAEGKRIAHRAAVLPSFRSSFSLRQEEDQDKARSTGFEERAVYRVSLSQPVYHWGAKAAEKQIGELIYEGETINAEGTGKRLLQKVRRDYMALVIAKQEIASSQEALESKRGYLDFQKKQLEAGAVSASSIEPIQLEVDRLELGQLKALRNWQEKVAEFSAYIGAEPVSLEEAIAGEIPGFDPLTEEETAALRRFFPHGLEQDVALQKSALDLEIEKRRLAIERKSLYPKFDAEVGMSSNALDRDGVRREQEYVYFGLNVGWNIFDGFRTKGRRIETATRLSRLEHSRNLLEASQLRSYERSLSSLDIARRSLEIEERSLAMARREFEEAKEGVAEERLPQAELGRAKREYEQHSIRAQKVRVSYLDTLSEFALLLGIDPIAISEEI